jgi:hypothetical protein
MTLNSKFTQLTRLGPILTIQYSEFLCASLPNGLYSVSQPANRVFFPGALRSSAL